MATVKFLYRSRKEIGPLTVRLLFRHSGKDFVIEAKTRIILTKKEWELLSNPRRIKDARIKNKKLELDSHTSRIEKLVLEAFSATHPSGVDSLWLNELIESYYSVTTVNNVPLTILEYFPRYLDAIKNQVSKSTIVKYKTSEAFLKKYCKDTKERPLISDVDPNFQLSIEDYAFERDYALNTVSKYITIIKSLCKHALTYDNIELSPKFNLIKLKTKRTPIIYLNFNELTSIKSIPENILGDRLSNVRDWLIISCFTGQRISDFMNFSSRSIRDDNGIKVIDLIQQKGGKNVTIPLLEPVLSILDKYNGSFPKPLSDQKYNDYIKEVAKIAGLNDVIEGGKTETDKKGKIRKVFGKYSKHELITSHIGRRSFASNFYGKIPTPILMNITGHTKESTFLGYIGVSSRDTAKEAARAFNSLNINI